MTDPTPDDRKKAAESCATHAEAKWLEHRDLANKAWKDMRASWLWPSHYEVKMHYHNSVANCFNYYWNQCTNPRASIADIAHTQRVMEHHEKGLGLGDD